MTLNGYRNDNFTPYIYVSENYGKTWKSIASNIPASAVNVILEDPINENLLFVGTDNGLYVSFNQGQSWEIFQNGIPNVAVHDLVIQAEAKDLLVGTHGRSIYKTNIARLQEMNAAMMAKDFYVFQPEKIKHSTRWGSSWSSWGKPQTPGLDITFFTTKPGVYDATITTENGIPVSSTSIAAEKGFNILSYDLAFSKSGKSAYLKKVKTELVAAKDGKTYLPKGKYLVILEGKNVKENVSFEIE